MINGKAEYVTKSDVNITVSDKTKLSIQELSKYLNSKIISMFKNICSQILKDLNELV